LENKKESGFAGLFFYLYATVGELLRDIE